MKKLALLLFLSSCAVTKEGVKRDAEARVEDCCRMSVAQNLDSRNSCVDDALNYCNSQQFGPNLCSREELSQHAQFAGFRKLIQDAGAGR